MLGERTAEGLEIRLVQRGAGRFLGAGFLAVWLAGWAAGEAFVLWVLVRGAAALLAGGPPAPGREPLVVGPALAAGAFLLLWLALWTVGGLLALRELLRLLWAEDRIVAGGGGVGIRRTIGPFRTARTVPRESIRGVMLLRRDAVLALDTGGDAFTLSTLGTAEERRRAAGMLRDELGIAAASPAADATLPEGWEAVVTPEGERALVTRTATRRTQARVASFLALAAAGVAAAAAAAAWRRPGPSAIAGAVVALAVAAALACGAVWLARGRMEWRLGSGRMTLRRRFGAEVRDVFEARRLELVVSTDSDGDDWFALDALADAERAAEVPLPGTPGAGSGRRRIAQTLHDPRGPGRLGAWLAAATGMPLEDRTTRSARERDLESLRARLAGSGRLGRLGAALIARRSPPER